MKRNLFLLAFFLIFLITGCGSNQEGQSGPASASAYIENKGSDTIVNLALAWAEQYQIEHPEIRISVTGGGSGTGIASLINGTVGLANASRQITADETKQAEAQGIHPVEHIIARDAIAVIVNPGNPVSQLTLQQVSDIYSGKISNWQQIGGEDRPIVRLSRETNSGTHVYFLATVLRLGDSKSKTLFSTDTLLLPSSEGIINELRQNPNAIGYDGLGYVPKDLKVIALAGKQGAPYVLPSIATVNNNTYAVSRDLYMYTAGDASGAMKAYLDWIVSPEGQKIVASQGFVPVAR